MATLELEGWDELQQALARIDDRLVGRTKLEAVQAAGEVVATVARALCPRSGGEDDQKPLAETIAVEVRDYGERALAVIGPQYPAGAHGHLVEDGHEIVTHDGKRTGRRAQPHPFVRPAFDQTQGQQIEAMQGVVNRTLAEIGS